MTFIRNAFEAQFYSKFYLSISSVSEVQSFLNRPQSSAKIQTKWIEEVAMNCTLLENFVFKTYLRLLVSNVLIYNRYGAEAICPKLIPWLMKSW